MDKNNLADGLIDIQHAEQCAATFAWHAAQISARVEATLCKLGGVAPISCNPLVQEALRGQREEFERERWQSKVGYQFMPFQPIQWRHVKDPLTFRRTFKQRARRGKK